MAGTLYVDGRIPGQEIARATRTTSPAGFTTTEVVLDTLPDAPLVSGRLYDFWWLFRLQTTVAEDTVNARFRLTDVNGTSLWLARVGLVAAGGAFGFLLKTSLVATTTGLHTIVGTGDRLTGSGTITSPADADNTAVLSCNYVSG